MKKFLDLLKRFWPTILPVLVFLLSLADKGIQDFLVTFGVTHPQLAALIATLWVAIANWLRGLQVPSVSDAHADLQKAVAKADAKQG